MHHDVTSRLWSTYNVCSVKLDLRLNVAKPQITSIVPRFREYTCRTIGVCGLQISYVDKLKHLDRLFSGVPLNL